MTRADRVPIQELRESTRKMETEHSDEMCIPSYGHSNPLVKWLFWRRLDISLELADLRPEEAVLDFGVGTGVLLPSLHRCAARVAATDIRLEGAQALAKARGLPTEFVPLEDFGRWVERNAGRFDCILALDVLEHVEDDELDVLGAQFRTILSPRGRLIVSGPTESPMYRLARRVAGYHSEFHHRNVFDIDRSLRRQWVPTRQRRLPPAPFPRAFVIVRYEASPANPGT